MGLDARDLEVMLGGVPDAVTVQERSGQIVYANAAALRLLGYESVDALLAAPIDELRERFESRDEDGRPIPVSRLPGRQALEGLDPEPLVVRHRSLADGELRWTRVQATPVRDPDGAPRLAINVIEDITDIKRAELGYRFLADASRVLAGSLDYEATLRTVADLAVPHIADWCRVDVVGPDGFQTVRLAHADPGRLALAEKLQERYPPEPGGARDIVAATGEPRLIAEITEEMIVAAARDDEHLAMIRALGLRSVMVVPMTLRGEVLGVISFGSAEAGRRFDESDLALAQDLGLRAAVAIDNARLYRATAAIASTLQASLLPPHLPDVPGGELAAVYRPAGEGIEVGGDFYDVFNLAEDQWYLVIGDVCGKGAEAAAITALARYTIRAAAVRRRSPSAILRWLNDAMLHQDETAGRFCTIACLHLDLARTPARLSVACGGHPVPLVRRAGGDVEPIGIPGTLLGLVEGPELQDRTTELHPGDTLVAWTDGLTEGGAPDLVLSDADVSTALSAAGNGTVSDLVERLVEAALGEVPEPRDDIAVLALRMAT